MIKYIKSLFRLLYGVVMISHHAGYFILRSIHTPPLLLRLWIGLCGGYKKRDGLQTALFTLGPAYVKMGQFLATRHDIIPPILCHQLTTLQDNVPEFSKDTAIHILETELGVPLDTVFTDFSNAVAAASVAQVHFATLKQENVPVAVKILRPNIVQKFNNDIYAFYQGAKLIHFFFKKIRRLQLPVVVKVFEEWVSFELDLCMEAASLTSYQDKCQKYHHTLITPTVYWNYVTPSVLVTKQISGTPLTQKDKILESGFDLEKIAENLMLIFLHDATHTGYFHGDLHQGNIFITDTGKIALLDFGVMGYLDITTRSYLAKILYGFVIRDYDWIAQLHFDAGYIPKHHSVIRFSQALRAVGEPIFGKTANDISMGKLLAALLNVTQRFDMETRPELILLQKNMVSIEGVCKMLYPQTDIWKISRPLLEKWVKENMGLQNKIHKMVERFIQKII